MWPSVKKSLDTPVPAFALPIIRDWMTKGIVDSQLSRIPSDISWRRFHCRWRCSLLVHAVVFIVFQLMVMFQAMTQIFVFLQTLQILLDCSTSDLAKPNQFHMTEVEPLSRNELLLHFDCFYTTFCHSLFFFCVHTRSRLVAASVSHTKMCQQVAFIPVITKWQIFTGNSFSDDKSHTMQCFP